MAGRFRLRTDRHWLILAQTRSGKTTLLAAAVRRALAAGLDPARVLLINPKRDRTLETLATEAGIRPWLPLITPRGTVPTDLALELRRRLEEGNSLVVVDELQTVARENDADPIWRWLFQMGAGRGVGVWATTTRAVWIPREAVTEAHLIVAFRLTDLASLGQLKVRHPGLLAAARLPEYHWLAQEIGRDPIHMDPIQIEGGA